MKTLTLNSNKLKPSLTLKSKHLSSHLIHGHDPLINSFEDGDDLEIFEGALKDSIHSILRCYTGFFDIFSELIQNALDATEKKAKEVEDYTPKIWIDLNIEKGSVRVTDNGCGMNLKEFKYCFRPSITFKKGQNLRGNKGVGATFLAYGYNFIHLQTKQDKNDYSAILRQARNWVEDSYNKFPKPKYEGAEFDVKELAHESSGTAVEIILTGADTEKPKNFWWFGSSVADQWLDILRVVSPLGGIYIKREKFNPTINIKITDRAGVITEKNGLTNVEFFYPHDIPNIKEKYITDIRQEINVQEGDLETRMQNLPSRFKNLNCLWDIWDYKDLLDADYLKLELSEEEKSLILKHKISVYGSQVDSLETFKAFNEKTGMRQNIKILRGGIQLATEGMAQGDLLQVSLNRQSGLQDYTFIIVHFSKGDPDTGRKNFQPELKAIAEKIATKITELIISYRKLLRPDTGSTKNLGAEKDKQAWMNRLVQYRNTNPIANVAIHQNFTYLSHGLEEQDVIAIFNQLIGCGILKGIYIFSNSYNERYDSLIELNYTDESYLYSEENPLGVRRDIDINDPYHPMVLEYKFEFDALLRDFTKKDKFFNQIDFVVCWQASQVYNYQILLQPLLVGKEGSRRTIFGATHVAYIPGIQEPIFEVLVLKELINFLLNKEAEITHQISKYKYR